jgi:hypothetical protein
MQEQQLGSVLFEAQWLVQADGVLGGCKAMTQLEASRGREAVTASNCVL